MSVIRCREGRGRRSGHRAAVTGARALAVTLAAGLWLAACVPESTTPDESNNAPVISEFALSYVDTASGGVLLSSTGAQIRWVAPENTGTYTLTVEVSDTSETTTGTVVIEVVPPPFTMDFSADEVSGNWSYLGVLTGLGDQATSNNIAWDACDCHDVKRLPVIPCRRICR